MRRVATSWKLIEGVLEEHAHSAYKALRPPASRRQIDRLQEVLKAKLPGDLVNSLRIHDGMSTAGTTRQDFVNYMTLLPCARVIANWKLLWSLQCECEFGGDQVTRTRKIKNDAHWRAGWVPIMEFEGDLIVLDLDPGPTGRRGQVVAWYNYGSRPMRVLADSFGGWLDTVADELVNRRFTLDEWGGIHLRKRLA